MPELALLFFAIPFALLMLGLLVWSLVWVHGDAVKRGKPGGLVVLMVLFMNWPASLLVWLVFRPELKTDVTT